MTNKIISMQEYKDSKEPHIEGPATCLECDHKWHTVAPAGVVQLECPECSLFKGIFISIVLPDMAYTCPCGCILFCMSVTGALCIICGRIHESITHNDFSI